MPTLSSATFTESLSLRGKLGVLRWHFSFGLGAVAVDNGASVYPTENYSACPLLEEQPDDQSRSLHSKYLYATRYFCDGYDFAQAEYGSGGRKG